jgi:hypothetical protein
MKRKHIIAVLAVTLIAGGFVGVQAAEKTNTTKTQTTCPVMGGKINKAQFVDAKGFRIYVCCPGCIAKVKANTHK